MNSIVPPTGYRWAERATFFAPGWRHTSYTECVSCGFRKGEHGPDEACPQPTEEIASP